MWASRNAKGEAAKYAFIVANGTNNPPLERSQVRGAFIIRLIDAGPGLEQQWHARRVAILAGDVEWRCAVLILLIGGGPGLEQRCTHASWPFWQVM